MKEALNKFILALVFRTSLHVQSHQYSNNHVITGGSEVLSRTSSFLHAAHEGKNGAH
jgi:hypothetical protein